MINTNILTKMLFCSMLLISAVSLSACNDKTEKTPDIQIPPVSVQLWSVKNTLKQDFKGTLQKIADMGFQGVEFAGNYGEYAEDPEGLKAYLKSLGLTASGAHLGIDKLRGENLDKNIAYLKKLGVDLIIIPMDSRAFNAEQVKEFTQELSQLSKKLGSQNMLIGYHNHSQEFATFEDTTYWDYIAQNTPDSVFLQLDVGWVNFAKQDPIEYVKRYAGRTLTTHIKVRTYKGREPKNTGKSPIIGQDNYDWGKLIKTLAAEGGTRWLVLEQEEYPNGLDEMGSVAASKKGLDKIIQSL